MLHIAEEEIVLDDDKEIAPVREEGVQDPQAEEDIDEESRTKFASVVVLEAHQKCQMWQRKNCNTESSVRCGVLVWRGVAWRGVAWRGERQGAVFRQLQTPAPHLSPPMVVLSRALSSAVGHHNI